MKRLIHEFVVWSISSVYDHSGSSRSKIGGTIFARDAEDVFSSQMETVLEAFPDCSSLVCLDQSYLEASISKPSPLRPQSAPLLELFHATTATTSSSCDLGFKAFFSDVCFAASLHLRRTVGFSKTRRNSRSRRVSGAVSIAEWG